VSEPRSLELLPPTGRELDGVPAGAGREETALRSRCRGPEGLGGAFGADTRAGGQGRSRSPGSALD
jgi:hypothetical protein